MNAKRETKKALAAKAADAKKTVAIKAAGLSKNAMAAEVARLFKLTAARELATIVAEIHETFRNGTASIVKRGEWLQWLCTHFAWDARTAQRQMAVSKWAAKYASAVVFNLSVYALYALGGGNFSEKVVKTVMPEAATRLIHARTLMHRMIAHTMPPPSQAQRGARVSIVKKLG